MMIPHSNMILLFNNENMYLIQKIKEQLKLMRKIPHKMLTDLECLKKSFVLKSQFYLIDNCKKII